MKEKKLLHKINLQYRLFGMFIIAFVLPLILFSVLLFSNIQNILREKTRQYEWEIISRTETSLNDYFTSLENTAKNLLNDEKFNSKIGRQEKDYANKVEYIADNELIFGKLSNVLVQRKEIKSVYLYTRTGINYYVNFEDTIDTTYSPANLGWYTDMQNTGRRPQMLARQPDLQAMQKTKMVIPFVYPVKIYRDNGNIVADNIGILQINIDPAEFGANCGLTGSEGNAAYIADGSGKIVYSTASGGSDLAVSAAAWNVIAKNGSGSFDLTQQSGSKLVSYKTSANTGLAVIMVTDNGQFVKDISNISTFFIVFILIMLFLFILLSNLIARSISVPINKLQNIIFRIQANQFEGRIEIGKAGRGSLLSDHFNNLADTLNNFLDKIEYHHRVEKEQDRNILEAQINPHFIYNTLNAIRWIATMQQAHEVAAAIKSLINLLQSSIKFGQSFISIEEEENQIRDYIVLQQLRYVDSFKVVYEIDEEAKKYKTIKFMLQPIVENAIFHGIDHEEKNGEIVIRIVKEAENIEYTIRDNGRGMTEERVKSLFSEDKPEKGFNGIGLKNVNERIRDYFGAEYGLDIRSEPGRGTTVRITLPAIIYEEE